MNRIVPVAALLTAVTCVALAQRSVIMNAKSSSSNAVEQEIERLHREYCHAQLINDLVMLDQVWADDHTFTNMFGVVQSKADRLADAKSGARTLNAIDLDDLHVRVYRETAVVTSRVTATLQLHGQDLNLQGRATDVYVKKGGRWQVVASQATRIAQP